MPNIMNLLGVLMWEIGGGAMIYAFWEPIMGWLGGMPTALYIVTGSMWVLTCFIVLVVSPVIILTTDDKGE